MRTIIKAVSVAIVSYAVALHFGEWCGIATLLLLVIILKNVDD